MKKLAIRLLIALLVLIVLAVLAARFFLDGAIRRGVETVGPMVTKVDVKLAGVSLSLLSGSGKITGLVVGNPEGYKTPSAIQVGRASLAVQPGSIFSDKVVIRSVDVQAPEITLETDLKGNNLSKIIANVDETTGGADKAKPSGPAQKKASKKLQVDDFRITGGKIHVSVTALGGQSVTVPLPEIHLTGLGQGPEGITAAELTKTVLHSIEKESIKAASGTVTDLSKQAANQLTKGLGTNATGAVESVTKGIGGLFKKK